MTQGFIPLTTGDKSVFFQDGNYTIEAKDRSDSYTPIHLAIDGSIGSVMPDKPFRMQAVDFLQGAFVDIYPSSFDVEGFHYRSGMVGVVATLNSTLPEGATVKPADVPYVGPAFDVTLFKGLNPPKGSSWPSIFSIAKTGDVVLGDPYERTSWPQIEPAALSDLQWAGGTRLFFSGGERLNGLPANTPDNTDPIFLHRFNELQNKSTLRVSLGDDGTAPDQSTPDKMEIGYYDNGGYGTWHQGVALYASGQIYARKAVVTTANYPDYVFKPSYRLRSLQEVEQAIQTQGHLPGMPSAAEVEAKGMDLGEQNRLLVEKVEELTLYLIQMRKELDALKATQK